MTDHICVNTNKALHLLIESGFTPGQATHHLTESLKQPSQGYYKATDIMNFILRNAP